jgi:hypothetical protein
MPIGCASARSGGRWRMRATAPVIELVRKHADGAR